MVQENASKIDSTESKFLNILRGLAILGVVSMHSMQSVQELNVHHISEHVSQVLYLGKYGVELFFFLSGWLLSAIYGFSDTKIGKNYMVRRIARIYPLWIIFLIFYILEAHFLRSGGYYQAVHSNFDLLIVQQPFVITLLALTFTLFISSNLWNTVIPGGWSIQSEIGHYLLFPVFRKQGLHRTAQIIAVLNLFSLTLLLVQSNIEKAFPMVYACISAWLRLGLYSTFSFFFAGVLANQYLRRDINTSNKNFWESKSLMAFVVTSVLGACPQGIQIEAIGYLALNLILAYVLIHLSRISTVLVQLGRYSYFMYFAHFIILRILVFEVNSHQIEFNFPADQIAAFLLIFLTTLSLSYLIAIPSYKYFEKPLISYFH